MEGWGRVCFGLRGVQALAVKPVLHYIVGFRWVDLRCTVYVWLSVLKSGNAFKR